MLPAAGARRSAYVPVAGAAARGAVWPRRRRLDPVELDHHLTSPTSHESHARTHARASTQVTDWRTYRRAPAGPTRSCLMPAPRPARVSCRPRARVFYRARR
jgi:hypothetical protein